ncbi:MAG: hypothetical protein ABSC19_14315 [Syntrophorhabdales bacterium]|jgi:hypothetical protein
MQTKQMVCNDCGCRFELRDSGKLTSQTPGKAEAPEKKTDQTPVSCPKCQGFNVTTA